MITFSSIVSYSLSNDLSILAQIRSIGLVWNQIEREPKLNSELKFHSDNNPVSGHPQSTKHIAENR